MNCREAQSQIFAERDRALDNSQRASLEAHVAQCAACRRIGDDLAAALLTWRTEAQNITVPDADREWQAVRRRLRGGEGSDNATSRSRRNWFAWLALPLGAAAAAALALYISPSRPSHDPIATVPVMTAHADLVEAPGNNASTMVFVDDKSGWLIVWASDATIKRG